MSEKLLAFQFRLNIYLTFFVLIIKRFFTISDILNHWRIIFFFPVSLIMNTNFSMLCLTGELLCLDSQEF